MRTLPNGRELGEQVRLEAGAGYELCRGGSAVCFGQLAGSIVEVKPSTLGVSTFCSRPSIGS